MSFSSKTKNELARILNDNKCCQKAELSGLFHVSGSLHLKGAGKVATIISTENAAVARLIFTLIKKVFKLHTNVITKKNKTLKKSTTYEIHIDDSVELLRDLEILSKDQFFSINNRVPKEILKKECCKRAYIRGVFLGGGSLNDPEKSYHLEFVTHNYEYSSSFSKLINIYELNSKIIERKSNYIVYLKEGDKIVDLLNVIGAHSTLLNFENVRIIKQMRNNVNRIVNCETANLNKTVDAALRQVENIELIKNTIGLGALPDNLIEIAEIRLENRSMSLSELGKLFDPPIGKSGINHRLRKIEDIATKIREEKQ